MNSRLLADLADLFAAEARGASAREYQAKKRRDRLSERYAHEEFERLSDISDELLARSDEQFRMELGIR